VPFGLLLLFLFVFPPATDAPPQGQPTQAVSVELGDLQVAGVRRYTAEDVKQISGLEVGKRVSIADLDAAAERMAKTGLFKTVSYRYATNEGRLVVTFEIEESEWTVPVVFDNLVWFTDTDVVAAVRTELPSFDGTVPATSGIPERITAALQQLLASRHVEGRIDFLPRADLDKSVEGYLFRVVDPGPKICALRFDGASAIAPGDLTAALKNVVGSDYSRMYLINASKGTLVDLYRRAGYWRASFGEPKTTLQEESGCNGVAVTVAVDEGTQYSWAGATWTGSAVLASSELDGLLGMKTGDVAAMAKLDDALRRIARTYARQGYLVQRATYTSRLDDSSRQATFEIRVAEGPQFRLGSVDFVNLAPADAVALRKVWRLRAGDVYDNTYPDQFIKEEIVPRLNRLPRTETDLDVKKAIVNVRFVFQ
jgi:outer membrane protein assembly factor BamA